MTTISEQAGTGGRVINLASAAWRDKGSEPVPPGAARMMADLARLDEWVGAMGGYAGRRFNELYREAVEFAGPDGATSYLDMARSLDEEHAASAGKWLAEAAIELANARSAREAARQRVNEIRFAAGGLPGAPRAAGIRYGWDDLAAVIELSAETGRLASTPAPRGKPGGPGLYDVAGMGHTNYEQQIVKALIEKRGMDPHRAYAIARGAIRKWMRGGGHVHPEVRDAATAAEAGELAKQARAKAIHGH